MKEKKRKITSLTETRIVNETTGEVISARETNVIHIPGEPNFIKLYLDAVMYISDIPTGVSKVMFCVLKRLPYADSNEQGIQINKYVRTKIADELGVSEEYIKKSIIALVKGQLLIHDNTTKRSCNYKVNPYVFGKGECKDIEELRLNVNFNAKGKTFWGEVKKSNNSKKFESLLENNEKAKPLSDFVEN